jgi:hypothetical protein
MKLLNDKKTFLFSFVFLSFFSNTVLSAPERLCEIQQAAWCLLDGAAEIIDKKGDTDSKFSSVWYVSGPLSPNNGFFILEPNGCRKGTSDVLTLVSYENQFMWNSQSWQNMIFRLKSDKSCDLEVLVPVEGADKLNEAFSHAFLLIKSCNNAACDGYVVNEKVSIQDLNKATK